MKNSFSNLIYLLLVILAISYFNQHVLYIQRFERIEARLDSLENPKGIKIDSKIPTVHRDAKLIASKSVKKDTVNFYDEMHIYYENLNKHLDSLLIEQQVSIRLKEIMNKK